MPTNEENIVKFLKKSERIMKISMSQLSTDIVKLQSKRKLTPSKYGKSIKANKDLLKSISKEYDNLRETLNEYCSDSIANNWELANFKNDELVEKTLTGTISTKYFNHNTKALNQFLKSSPFKSKIYQLTKDSEQLVSDYLATGITQGRSANSIARDLNKINANPYDVTVFDVDGNPTKLKKVSPFLREYKAQRGQYKKPLSNLKRLVRTETNKAYHGANMERIKQLDFIVGYEVKLSDSHSDRVPKGDMCDNLKGKYPKTFKFSSWHPNCMCFVTTILKTNEEIRNDKKTSVNTVKKIPTDAKEWIKNAKPYEKNYDWLSDNDLK